MGRKEEGDREMGLIFFQIPSSLPIYLIRELGPQVEKRKRIKEMTGFFSFRCSWLLSFIYFYLFYFRFYGSYGPSMAGNLFGRRREDEPRSSLP